jgi:Flp pilus assembly secretin CpaC
MTKFSKRVIVSLAGLLAVSILCAKSACGPEISERQVLVEAMMLEVSSDALDRLQIGQDVIPSSKVTVPLATLLYVLANPNAVKTIVSPKIVVYTGQTGQVTDAQKLKYLAKTDEGSFEERTTVMPVGTTLEARPRIDKEGDILLDFKFEHFAAASPKEIDPQTSLRIGPPIISCSSVNTRLKLKPGQPMIAGGIEKPTGRGFILVRAEILAQPAGDR